MGRKELEIQLRRKRKLGTPKRRYLDVAKDDMRDVGARKGEVFD